MDCFTAIDFETANYDRHSICQIGLVRVEHGIITHEICLLVKPPNNYYIPRFTDIHGISPSDTRNAPTFDLVWPRIESFIKNQHVVAHNGFSFDFNVLQKALDYYGFMTPVYDKHCTYKIFKTKLNLLCEKYNILLNHHEALSDARACAKLFLISLAEKK